MDVAVDLVEDIYDDDDVDSGNVSSEDDDFAIMEVDVTSSRERQNESEDYQFEVLTTDQIVQDMVNTINEVNSVVNLPPTTTRILLNHFKWDKEKLMEKYFDGNQEKFFREAHVINPFNKPNLISIPKVLRSRTEECEICFSLFPPIMMTGLECGHRFCTQCWGEYLTTKIMEEGLGQSIACAAHGCDILVDDVTVMKLVTDSRKK